jgi:hypothetical protein
MYRANRSQESRSSCTWHCGAAARYSQGFGAILGGQSRRETPRRSLVSGGRECQGIRDVVRDTTLQNHRYARFTCTSRHVNPSNRLATIITGTRIMNFGSTDRGPSANSRPPVQCAARTDRGRHRSCAPDDRQEQPCQGETSKTVDLDCSSAVQSCRALADVQSAGRNHGLPLTSADFCNKICTSGLKIRHPIPACASNDRSRNHPFSCLP